MPKATSDGTYEQAVFEINNAFVELKAGIEMAINDAINRYSSAKDNGNYVQTCIEPEDYEQLKDRIVLSFLPAIYQIFSFGYNVGSVSDKAKIEKTVSEILAGMNLEPAVNEILEEIMDMGECTSFESEQRIAAYRRGYLKGVNNLRASAADFKSGKRGLTKMEVINAMAPLLNGLPPGTKTIIQKNVIEMLA
jgi:hypothetical protein